MDKKRLELIITAVLVVVFIFAWGNTLKVLKRRSAVTAPPTKNLVPEKETSVPVASQAKPKAEDLPWVRDPFSGKTYSQQGLGVELSLTGILWDPKRPQALINDKVCKSGDVINGYQVLEIQQSKVILSDGSKQLELKLD